MNDAPTPTRIRVRHLAEMKQAGQRFSMLTSYDVLTAEIFDAAGIEVLLVGDSLGNVVLGHPTTLPVGLPEMELFTAAVVRGVSRALIVADLPFGSYHGGTGQALESAVRLMKAGAHAVKLEGGTTVTPQIEALAAAGIPVMAHLGFTPQSEHQLGGHRVQGRLSGADALAEAAMAVQDAGAFAVVLELVPMDLAARITEILAIPTVGIGAGPDCDGQVLVWQDMAGLSGFSGRFVKQFANLREDLGAAARAYREEIAAGHFPAKEHGFDG